MLAAALILNICVLVPVVAGLTSGARTMELVFGADTNARRILTCVYGAIGMSSVLLLGLLFAGHPWAEPMIIALLALQVLYKLGTVTMIGVAHPVVRANLMVVAVHAIVIASVIATAA